MAVIIFCIVNYTYRGEKFLGDASFHLPFMSGFEHEENLLIIGPQCGFLDSL